MNYPKSVAIILDGNRRYAEKKKIFPRVLGHVAGKKTLEVFLINWSKMKEPKYLTLYVFSLYNLKNRNFLERNFIFKLLESGFKELLNTKEIYKNKIKVSFLGKIKDCSNSLQRLIHQIENKTKNHNKKFLNFCVCYDGHEEITNAFNEMIKNKIKKADVQTVKKYLYTKNLPPVDLLIRTGGEKRISGFLPWDVSYAELIFREETWPEYTLGMFKADLKEFQYRNRRFGK